MNECPPASAFIFGRCTPICVSLCTACADGAFLSAGSCILCHPTCKTCTAAGDTGCTNCIDGTVRAAGASCSYYCASPCATCYKCSYPGKLYCLTCA